MCHSCGRSGDLDLVVSTVIPYSKGGSTGSPSDYYVEILDAGGGMYNIGVPGLYRNDGNGALTLVPGSPNCGTGCAWGDIDADGDLDLVVVNGYGGKFDAPNMIYRNDGADIFTALTDSPFATSGASSLSVNFADYDGDGAPRLDDAFLRNLANPRPRRLELTVLCPRPVLCLRLVHQETLTSSSVILAQ